MRHRLRRLWYRMVGFAGVNGVTRRLHPIVYRWTGGAWFIGHPLGNLVVLLTTTGHRSGKQRTVPLWAYPDGERLVLVGSNGGRHALPGWVANLRARPEAELEVRRERRAVRSSEAVGEEYERLWRLVTAAYPGYEAYREWAHRPIPLVVLGSGEPEAPEAPGSTERREP